MQTSFIFKNKKKPTLIVFVLLISLTVLKIEWSSIPAILLSVFYLYKFFKEKRDLRAIPKGYFILTLIPILLISSLIFFPDIANYKKFEKFFVFFCIPFIFGINDDLCKKSIRILFKTFVFSTTIICIYALIKIVLFRFNNPYIAPIGQGPWVIEYILIHRPYFGMFAIFSIIIIINFLEKRLIKNTLGILLVLIHIVIIFLVVAKMAIILLSFLILYFIIKYIINGSRKLGILALFLLVITHLLSYNYNLHFNKRIISSLKNEPRLIIWKCTTDSFKEVDFNIIYGFKSLIRLQQKINPCIMRSNRTQTIYNTHNQFLSFYGAYGIIGLFVFIFIMIYFLNLAIKNKDELFIMFIILILIQSLTENILARQWGIFFFAIFIGLFMKRYEHKIY